MRIKLMGNEAREWLIAWADSIWPEGAYVSPDDEERACQIWSAAGRLWVPESL